MKEWKRPLPVNKASNMHVYKKLQGAEKRLRQALMSMSMSMFNIHFFKELYNLYIANFTRFLS